MTIDEMRAEQERALLEHLREGAEELVEVHYGDSDFGRGFEKWLDRHHRLFPEQFRDRERRCEDLACPCQEEPEHRYRAVVSPNNLLTASEVLGR